MMMRVEIIAEKRRAIGLFLVKRRYILRIFGADPELGEARLRSFLQKQVGSLGRRLNILIRTHL